MTARRGPPTRAPRGAAALLFAGLLLPSLRSASAQTKPPAVVGELHGVLESSARDLCRLYDVPPALCSQPVHVRVVESASALPAEWRGFPAYAAGAAEPASGRILIDLSRCGPYPFGDAAQTLRHEVSHVMLYRALGYEPPRWLDEGLAMRASGDWSFADSVYATLALPYVARGSWSLQRVEADFAGGEGSVRRSYALVKGFVRDLFPDDASVTAFVVEARRDGSVGKAFRRRFGVSPEAAFRAWAKNMPWWGRWLEEVTSPAVLWVAVTLLFLVAAALAWRRRRKKYEALPD